MDFIREKKEQWEYFHIPQLTQAGIIHGFFTRNSPSFTPEHSDMQDFLTMFQLESAIWLFQEHGNIIHVLDNAGEPKAGDGILLAKRGMAGIIKTADCLCVIAIDPASPMAVIVHAGWRGTMQKITSKAIDMMVEHGAARQRIIALMGPSIRGCCYTVGPEVKDQFLNQSFPENTFRYTDERIYLDLAAANSYLLKSSGVEIIHDSAQCTYCSHEADFASYRKGARNERQANFVAIKKPGYR